MVAWPAGNISVEATTRPSNIINEAMRHAAFCGYGEWREGSRSCSSIGAPMVEPPAGRWEPYDGRLSRTVL